MSLEKTHFPAKRTQIETTVLVIMGVLSVISVVQGFRNAIEGSTDLQWSPTHLLSQGINPYSVAISGNKEGKILLTQIPPYLHLLYVLFLPFGYLTFLAAKIVWAALNFAFASVCALMLSRFYRLSTTASLILAALFFSSTALRNTIGNGQTSLLCFFSFFIAWIYQDVSETKAGLSLSVLLVKYSFAPPILLWFLIQRKFRLILFSLAPLVLGWLLFSWICHQNPMTTAEQPLKVASIYNAGGGGGDVMTLVQSLKLDSPVLGGLRESMFVGVLASSIWVVVLRFRNPHLTDREVFAGLGLVSMLSLRHLPYDYVFLAPAAALAFSLPSYRRTLAFALVGFFWFGLKLLDNLHVSGIGIELCSFLALNMLLALVMRIGEKEARLPRQSRPRPASFRKRATNPNSTV